MYLQPVEDVEGPVESETGHIVGCDVFDLLDLHDHVQLRVDGQRLQPDRVAPAHLKRVRAAMHEHRKHRRHLIINTIVDTSRVTL